MSQLEPPCSQAKAMAAAIGASDAGQLYGRETDMNCLRVIM